MTMPEALSDVAVHEALLLVSRFTGHILAALVALDLPEFDLEPLFEVQFALQHVVETIGGEG